jgi:hypothetical protein
MFNTLASYLSWNSNQNNQEEISTEDISENQANYKNFVLTPSEVDSDWLLVVDKEDDTSTGSSEDSETELPFIKVKNGKKSKKEHHEFQCQELQLYVPNKNVEFMQKTYIPTTMDESWFVTPPPCFTSTGPISVKTSPLENLLIEHPSMSVYRFMRSSSDEIQDDIVVLDFDRSILNEVKEDEISSTNETRVVAQNRSELIQQIFNEQPTKLIILERKGQKTCEKKTRNVNGRNTIERMNKVREMSFPISRRKRNEMHSSNFQSRCNNNRKC